MLCTGTSKVEQQKSVATALLALQYWLDQLTKCPALQPYNSCITLLCTAANCTGTQAGAQLCGLPVDNIHCCEDQKQVLVHYIWVSCKCPCVILSGPDSLCNYLCS